MGLGPRSLAAQADAAALVARAQQGDQAAIAELDQKARVEDVGHIGESNYGVVNQYREALQALGDPTNRGNGLERMTHQRGWLGEAIHDVGGVVSKAAPLAALIPGVGPLAAAGIAAAGSAAHGDSLGKVAMSGLTGYGGAKLVGAAKGALAARGAAGAAGAAGATGAPAAAAGGGGGLAGLAGSAIGYAKKNPQVIAGALGAINSAGQQAKGANAVDRASGIALNDYNQTAPLRRRAVELLSQPAPQARDLSYLNDSANPFARRAPVAPVAPVANAPVGAMNRY